MAGHTAILPTMQLDAGKLEGLDDDEHKVMTRIVRRMWEAVGDDHVHIVTEVKARLPTTPTGSSPVVPTRPYPQDGRPSKPATGPNRKTRKPRTRREEGT